MENVSKVQEIRAGFENGVQVDIGYIPANEHPLDIGLAVLLVNISGGKGLCLPMVETGIQTNPLAPLDKMIKDPGRVEVTHAVEEIRGIFLTLCLLWEIL